MNRQSEFPKVSICIPAYNQPSNLRRGLKSVFLQTYKDFEVVITDDSPDDSIAKVVAEFDQNANLRYFKNMARKGSPKNWNEAVRLATGEYIKILHHDDWFYDAHSLAEFVAMLDHNPDAMLAFSTSLRWDGSGEQRHGNTPSVTQLKRLRTDPRILLQGNFIGVPSATIYRHQADQEFDARMKWLVDIDFYIRILKKPSAFVYCERPLVCVSIEPHKRVTNECQGDKQVEIFEYLYLYAKLSNGQPLNYRGYRVVWDLFSRFNIQSVKEIADCSVDFKLPQEVNCILHLRRIFNRTKQHLASRKMNDTKRFQRISEHARRHLASFVKVACFLYLKLKSFKR